MARQGLMDDCGYKGFEECARYESCTCDFIAELLEPYDVESIEELIENVRNKAIDEFAHALKETYNNEFPRNYHCTQPYFTLDNVRVLVDLVGKEQKQ